MRDRPGSKALVHAAVVGLSLSFVLVVMSQVAPAYAASVTQPIIVATPSGGSAFTYTVSGCSVSPTSGTSGTSSSPFTTAASCVLMVTMPSAVHGTRYVFASSASSTTVSTCSSGTCPTFSPSDYYQLSQTYTASSANAFPASSTVDIEGTRSGTFVAAACSISTGGTTSASCASGSSWFDFDTPVGFTSLSTQGTSSHQFSTTPLTSGLAAYWPCDEATSGSIAQVLDLSGKGITATPHNSPTYTKGKFGGACDLVETNSQYLRTSYSPAMAPTTAVSWCSWVYLSSDTGTIMGMFSLGGVNGVSPMVIYVHTGDLHMAVDFHWSDSTATYYQDTAAAVTARTWHFLCVTYDGSYIRGYVDGAPGTFTAATETLVPNSYGSLIGAHAGFDNYWNGYLDEMRVYTRALTPSEVTELYYGTPQDTIFTDTTAGNTHSVKYHDQFADEAKYALTGGGSPTPPSLTGIAMGSTMSNFLTLATSAQTVWLDASSAWSTTNPTPGSNGTQRWDSSAPNGTTLISGTTTIDPTYYNQYSYILSYSVTGGGSPSAPRLNSTQFGSVYTSTLPGLATAYWLDRGHTWSVTNPLMGASFAERWVPNATSGVVTGNRTLTVVYRHQYRVLVTPNVSSGGAVLPGTGWYDSGASLNLSANAHAGWDFHGWLGAGSGSYSGPDSTAALEIHGSLTEKGVFYAGLTVISAHRWRSLL